MNTANFKTRDNDRYCGACSGSLRFICSELGRMELWASGMTQWLDLRIRAYPYPQPLHIVGIMLKLGGFWMHGSGLALHAIDRFRFNHTVVAFFERFSNLRAGV